jgi:hypothetical protein
MLDFYLSSIVIWFIILFSEIIVLKDAIYKNGWLDPQKKRNPIRSIFSYVLVSAVPIFRLFVAIMTFVLATYSKEHYDKFVEELKTKDDTNERPRED